MKWYEDKSYHLMCKEAKEIQELWEMNEGDYYVNPRYGKHIILYQRLVNKDDRFWLPRQDQLQGMILTESNDYWKMIKDFNDWVDIYAEKIQGYPSRQFYSMEQLWLAFVMFEKFNKVWAYNKWEVRNEK